MKVLGVNGSPRSYGNTAKLLELALEGAKMEGAETERIDLYKLDIKPCLGCLSDDQLACRHPCPIEDDMSGLYEKVLSSDGLIIATPVCWYGLPGPLKNFMDRLTSLQNMIYHVGYSLLEGKVGGVVVAGGRQGGVITAAEVIASLNYMGFLIPPWSYAYYAGLGDALRDKIAVLGAVNVGRVVALAIKGHSLSERWFKSDLELDPIVKRVRARVEKLREKEEKERREIWAEKQLSPSPELNHYDS